MNIIDVDWYLERLDHARELFDLLDTKDYPPNCPLRQYVNGLLDGAYLTILWDSLGCQSHPAMLIRDCLREAYNRLHAEGKI